MLFSSASISSPRLPAANLAELSARLDTVPAVWPTGMARLGSAISMCERCGAADVCRDWLARAPAHLDRPPPFCPNASELLTVKKVKRG